MSKLIKIIIQEIKECSELREDLGEKLDGAEALKRFNDSYNNCVVLKSDGRCKVREEREEYALRRFRDYLRFND